MPATRFRNFGRNVVFSPRKRHEPRCESEVLELLRTHARSSIRAAGSLHAWSDAVATDEVLLDMRFFDSIDVSAEHDGQYSLVSVGGGCTIQRFLQRIHRDGLTLPTIGTVTRQTVAGAISTGLHGSGRPSLCHYVHAMRVAAYDSAGNPRVYEWTSAPDLAMARCSLGCAGIILSITFRCVPLYEVSERVIMHDSLESVLAECDDQALDEFALIPHLWRYVGYHRRVTNPRVTGWRWWRGSLRRVAYRWYKLIVIDWLFHAVLRTQLRLHAVGRRGRKLSDAITRLLFFSTRLLVQPGVWLTSGRGAVDGSTSMLTRKHDLFRHIEMEVFVPESHLGDATELLRTIVGVFAGHATTIPGAIGSQPAGARLLEDLKKHSGTYMHHYPLYFRRVLPDATVLSMTGGVREPCYAVGVFCYRGDMRPFYAFARVIATAFMERYGARLHWGKYLPVFPQPPVTSSDFERLYPDLPRFRAWCSGNDPNGVFQNDCTRRVLGFDGPRNPPS